MHAVEAHIATLGWIGVPASTLAGAVTGLVADALVVLLFKGWQRLRGQDSSPTH